MGRETGERLYRLLLRLYPGSFRRRYGADLVQGYRDRGSEPAHAGPMGRVRLWSFLLRDLLASALLERVEEWRRRRAEGPGAGLRGLSASLYQDVMHAVRSHGRSPGFLAAALLTLALGIGATTTIYSVVDGVLLKPLPYRSPERLVQVGATYAGYGGLASLSPPTFFDLRDRSRSFEHLAASRLEWLTVVGAGEPERVFAAGVSAEFFSLLGVEASSGRLFSPTDDRSGAARTAVLRHGFWQRRWGGAPGVVGQTVTFDDEAYTVIGILPPGFQPPAAIHQGDVQVWFPLSFVDDPLDQRGVAFLQVIGRLADGESATSATAELETIRSALARIHPATMEFGIEARSLRERTVGDSGNALFLLFGAAALLLLIACGNVAALFLVRGASRARELAIRGALGAGGARIARQLLTESVLVALAGGALGVILSMAGVRAFVALSPGDVPRLAEVGVDLRVLAFAIAVSVATGLFFGASPAIRGGRHDLRSAMGGREGGAGGVEGTRLRSALVVGEMALALVLLAGAGLLVNSFVRLARVDPGFRPENVVRLEVALPSRYDSPERRIGFHRELVERVATLPGVRSAGAVDNVPMGGNSANRSVLIEGRPPAAGERPPQAGFISVLPGYFETVGIPLLRGRAFDATDDADGPPVLVVNQTMARRFWPDGGAVGGRLRFSDDPDAPVWSVVGVVADIKQYGLDRSVEPEFFMPMPQSPRPRMNVVARADTDPVALLDLMRRTVWSMDPALPIGRAGTLREQIAESVIEPRFYAALLSAFAATALVLAFVGLYGVMRYAVELRRREFGIRLALGAERAAVRRMVVRRGMLLALAGLAIGLPGALAASRLLESFIFDVTPTDPATFAAVAALLTAAALLGSYLPARRASRVDPMRTLREE